MVGVSFLHQVPLVVHRRQVAVNCALRVLSSSASSDTRIPSFSWMVSTMVKALSTELTGPCLIPPVRNDTFSIPNTVRIYGTVVDNNS